MEEVKAYRLGILLDEGRDSYYRSLVESAAQNFGMPELAQNKTIPHIPLIDLKIQGNMGDLEKALHGVASRSSQGHVKIKGVKGSNYYISNDRLGINLALEPCENTRATIRKLFRAVNKRTFYTTDNSSDVQWGMSLAKSPEINGKCDMIYNFFSRADKPTKEQSKIIVDNITLFGDNGLVMKIEGIYHF